MEHLTQQNHDLEKQLCQRNPGHHTWKDQEGTNAEWRNQEGPKGSNAPSWPEQQDTSRPSVTNMAPPQIVAEM